MRTDIENKEQKKETYMRTDIENKEQKKESVELQKGVEHVEQRKESVEHVEQRKESVELQKSVEQKSIGQKKEIIGQNKEKKVVKNISKEQISIIKNFIGKDVTIALRNGNNLKGKLETVAQYELVITMSYTPIIVMKHAIDYIMLAGEKV